MTFQFLVTSTSGLKFEMVFLFFDSIVSSISYAGKPQLGTHLKVVLWSSIKVTIIQVLFSNSNIMEFCDCRCYSVAEFSAVQISEKYSVSMSSTSLSSSSSSSAVFISTLGIIGYSQHFSPRRSAIPSDPIVFCASIFSFCTALAIEVSDISCTLKFLCSLQPSLFSWDLTQRYLMPVKLELACKQN